jgi:hypothetical protein
VKVLGYLRKNVGQDEKIEGIEGPSEKTRKKGVARIRFVKMGFDRS